MTTITTPDRRSADRALRAEQSEIKREVARYQDPCRRQSLIQIANSFGGFFATCVAMYLIAGYSVWLALPLAPLAAGFMVRIFIIQHDCGHRAFFRSKRANAVVGFACSLLTLTPFPSWRRQHDGHHGVWNDLDRRQSGADIYSSCLTVAEYKATSRRGRFLYRALRHPLVANVLLPPFIFTVLYRLPFDMPASWRLERRMVHLTSLAIAAALVGLGLLVGFDHLLVVQLPVTILSVIVGVWLFSVQHRGKETRWERHADWSATGAALRGSTFLRLPRVLQWFTGNIGYHHIHHLNPRVPNYRLQECHEGVAKLSDVPTLSLWQGMRAVRYVLWDESRNRLVTVREAMA